MALDTLAEEVEDRLPAAQPTPRVFLDELARALADPALATGEAAGGLTAPEDHLGGLRGRQAWR